MRSSILAIPLLLASGVAFAGQASGNAALALASLVGNQSPHLSQGEKTVLAHFLDGDSNVPLPTGVRRITVTADKIICRMGDVDIDLHSCALTFGNTTITKSGETGQALLATLGEAGVQGDGAAGTFYYSLTRLSCTIDAAEVESHDGGGATCKYANVD